MSSEPNIARGRRTERWQGLFIAVASIMGSQLAPFSALRWLFAVLIAGGIAVACDR